MSLWNNSLRESGATNRNSCFRWLSITCFRKPSFFLRILCPRKLTVKLFKIVGTYHWLCTEKFGMLFNKPKIVVYHNVLSTVKNNAWDTLSRINHCLRIIILRKWHWFIVLFHFVRFIVHCNGHCTRWNEFTNATSFTKYFFEYWRQVSSLINV